MAEKLYMLALSPTMETGTIVRWHRDEGKSFSEGEVLCEVETDKATMDYEATTGGTLLKIIAPAGSKVRVGDLIGVSGAADEEIDDLISPAEITGPLNDRSDKGTAVFPGIASPPSEKIQESPGHLPDGVKASPLARAIARQKGMSLSAVHGSGPGGRVVRADVEQSAAGGGIQPIKQSHSAAAVPGDTVIPVTEKRRVIASRLAESKQVSPHFYLTVKAVMDELLAARSAINEHTDPHITLNAFLVKLVAEALYRHPKVNASWKGDSIVQHGRVDVALAVAQPDGLITPVVRDAAHKGIAAIDEELRGLIARAREGKLTPEEYSESTFTISNLGSYGVRQFTAIINPPNAAILAVGEVFREPYEEKNGAVAFRNAIMFSLSCDHRLVDGVVAAAFASDLRKMIEQPVMALL